jgi:hypothetical protein
MDNILVDVHLETGQPEPFNMTSWHADESFEEALWFLQYGAVDFELQDCEAPPALVAVVAAPERAKQARRLLGIADQVV